MLKSTQQSNENENDLNLNLYQNMNIFLAAAPEHLCLMRFSLIIYAMFSAMFSFIIYLSPLFCVLFDLSVFFESFFQCFAFGTTGFLHCIYPITFFHIKSY